MRRKPRSVKQEGDPTKANIQVNDPRDLVATPHGLRLRLGRSFADFILRRQHGHDGSDSIPVHGVED